jgi:predicted DNA-binding transcriptional regulator AlpA
MGFIPEKWFTKAEPSRPVPSLTPLPVVPVVPVVPVQKVVVPPAEEETIALRWVDAAAELNLNVNSVKNRTRREGWRKIIGNDGRALVFVPVAALEKERLARIHARSTDRAEELINKSLKKKALLVGKMALAERIGVSYSVLHRYIYSEGFPKPINISERKIMWKTFEVDEWIKSGKKQMVDKSTVYSLSGGKNFVYTSANKFEMNALSKYIIKKRSDTDNPNTFRSVPPLVCRDGFEISVQASGIHYSDPRSNEGPWMNFECGYPSKPVPELREWKEDLGDDAPDEDCVFAYVPWVAVMLTIEKHGGCDALEEMK